MTATDPAQPLLDKISPEIRTLMQALRALAPQVIPDVSEQVHMGWGVLRYQRGGIIRDTVAAQVPHKSYVNREFGDGVDLPDAAHWLEGTGKRLRHVKIRSLADLNDPDVRGLLEAAARFRNLPVSLDRQLVSPP